MPSMVANGRNPSPNMGRARTRSKCVDPLQCMGRARTRPTSVGPLQCSTLKFWSFITEFRMRFIVDVVGPRVCQAATSTSRQDPTGKVPTEQRRPCRQQAHRARLSPHFLQLTSSGVKQAKRKRMKMRSISKKWTSRTALGVWICKSSDPKLL